MIARLRRSLFCDALQTLLTLLSLGCIALVLPPLFQWGLLNAHFSPDVAACEALQGRGACWGVVAEKARFILLGRYPDELAWRPMLASGLILGGWLAGAQGWLRGTRLLVALTLPPFLAVALLGGGFAGLTPVLTENWGGLPLTLLLTGVGMATALPLGMAIAYGRRSGLPVVEGLLTAYVELCRGIPLVAALFVASFLLPLLLPDSLGLGMLERVLLAIVLFASAYVSEILRGGLQAFPQGQQDAAAALGLGRWQIQRWIVLPQVLRHVSPSLANSAISLFKDTSLVTVVSLYELTGSLGLALAGDAQWRPFYLEAWLFIAALYWLGCLLLARISRRLEKSPAPR
ncbi:amino acid ABC transporter permease [Zoogloea sp.]|uniref:amino acid ABC transporter permease n=1 Tax=Zoogloea sp. TaxID=49181 RepID=UPI002621031B|nr:amino acid ABC transporter permease [Zoogloea sp.]MDD3353538.1 amino acid ABC transporter permease [Zoogloea sp.]